MKKSLNTVAGIVALTIGSISAEAADYADMSNEELVQMRSQVREQSYEDREGYRTEMQNRMQSMDSEERSLFRQMNETGEQGEGSGKMNRYGQGGGNGSGNKYRYGQGSSQGSSQAYGSGYGSRSGGGSGGGRGRGH
ncbi:MAG: hypothetical protein OI74_01080 [Gammaproteobacteria bacterium (ex Lamellibrachia satsuma)]|nr:MAG: hypothetical protein HPY30_18275 [Gammaproteobacteria bacterium (ex Lamellibrachia satsuma)]RRS35978.1 MAG: hypothetical protein OI74_01080 [Gammaproteobacteria bacterium (ex Lamellibrachia satsuma)]RRS36570.1 MAG: hypothetical protein NV67_06750 [Gammaproteobacteria bacterium (ex Lamellibrachia satsuma)]